MVQTKLHDIRRIKGDKAEVHVEKAMIIGRIFVAFVPDKSKRTRV